MSESRQHPCAHGAGRQRHLAMHRVEISHSCSRFASEQRRHHIGEGNRRAGECWKGEESQRVKDVLIGLSLRWAILGQDHNGQWQA